MTLCNDRDVVCGGCRAAGEAFLQAEQKRRDFAVHLRPAAGAAVEVLLHGSVAKDMASLFRRSDAWAAGAEHVHLLSARPGAAAGDALEYVVLLGQVAESVAGHALQSVAGMASAHTCEGPAQDGAGFALSSVSAAVMSRFSTVPEALAFGDLPPCRAIAAADARCPVASLLDLVFEVEPADEVSTSTAPMSVL